jgi:hypothetical protein
LRSIPSNIKISRQNPTKCQRRLGHIRLPWDDPIVRTSKNAASSEIP